MYSECLLNNMEIEEPHSKEFLQLTSVYQWLLLLGLRPHRTELCIVHVGVRLAGQIDALFFGSSRLEARHSRLEADSGFEVRKSSWLVPVSTRSFARHELLDLYLAIEHVSLHARK